MVQVTPTQTFVVKGFPGGLNLEDYEHLRAADEIYAMDFALGPRGEAFVRAGLDLLAAHDSWTGAPDQSRLASLFSFTPDAGTNKFLIAVDLDGKVWRTSQGPASPLLACNVTGPTQISLGAPPVVPSGTTLGGYFILACEDDDPHYWNGQSELWTKVTDHTLDDSGTSASWEMPVCSTVCSGWGRLWAAGNDTYPSRLYWSGALGTLKEGTEVAAGPWNWPSTNWVDINPEDGGEITRVFPFGQAIMVFKNNSTYALVGAGDPASARLYPIHLNIGCTLPGTVAESTGRLFWATDDGVYTYDGSGVSRIDQKVRSYLTALAAGGYSKWSSGYAITERYHLHFPAALHGTEGYHLVYDTEGQHWEAHSDGGWGAALFSDTAYITRWGGVYTVGGNAHYDDMTAAGGTTSVAAPPAYLRTAWLPPPDQRTLSQYRVRRIDLYMERPATAAAPCSYRVSLYTDFNEDTRQIGYTLNLDTVEPDAEAFVVSLPGYAGLADAFSLRIDSNPASPDVAGNERIGLNGIAFVLSERTAKRGPRAVLPDGVEVTA